MKSSKRLALRRIVVSELAPDELQGISGANSGSTCPCVTTLHRECPSDPVTGCTIIRETQYASCAACTVTCPTDICV